MIGTAWLYHIMNYSLTNQIFLITYSSRPGSRVLLTETHKNGDIIIISIILYNGYMQLHLYIHLNINNYYGT